MEIMCIFTICITMLCLIFITIALAILGFCTVVKQINKTRPVSLKLLKAVEILDWLKEDKDE